MPLINGSFMYVKIQNPVPAYNPSDSEWSVDLVVEKVDAKALKKLYPKTSLKEYSNEEFVEKFKVEPPYPKQDEQFVLKFKKAHKKGDKITDDKYRPRVIEQLSDGSKEDVTFTKLIGNGSKGTLSYRIKETETYGNFVELQAILVTEMVEYQSKAGPVTSEFGDVKLKDVPQREVVATKQGGDTPAGSEEGSPF